MTRRRDYDRWVSLSEKDARMTATLSDIRALLLAVEDAAKPMAYENEWCWRTGGNMPNMVPAEVGHKLTGTRDEWSHATYWDYPYRSDALADLARAVCRLAGVTP